MRYTHMIVGNQMVTQYLQKTIKNGIVPRAQLWVGPDHIGKTTFLINYLFQVWCEKRSACLRCSSCRQLKHDSHTGLRWFDSAELDMTTLRMLLREAAETNFTAQQRALVLTRAEQLGAQLSNALLKLLEEPKGNLVVYLLTNDSDALPVTIVSRCSLIRFHPVPDAELLAAWPERAAEIPWCHGRPGLVTTLRLPEVQRWEQILQMSPVQRLSCISEWKRPEAARQLEYIEGVVYQRLDKQVPMGVTALRLIAQARRSLQTNAQIKYVMSNLLLNMYPTV